MGSTTFMPLININRDLSLSKNKNSTLPPILLLYVWIHAKANSFNFWHFFLFLCIEIQTRDPNWYSALTNNLTEVQQQELQEIVVLADQRTAARGRVDCTLKRRFWSRPFCFFIIGKNLGTWINMMRLAAYIIWRASDVMVVLGMRQKYSLKLL